MWFVAPHTTTRSAVPVDHLELIVNGEVARSFEIGGRGRSADISGTVTVAGSGWLLLRAWNEESHPLIFDLYPYATTSPVYVKLDGRAATSPEDAGYYLAWLARIREAVEAHQDFNDETERNRILANLDAARQRFMECR